MKEIRLTQNKVALVDDKDFSWLTQYSWHYKTGGGYANRRDYSQGKPGKIIAMHTEIMDTPKGFYVDHKNGNPLDNRRENLRFCTVSQNIANSRIQIRKNKSSKYKGVCWDKKLKFWRALIMKDYKSRFIGLYKSEEEAAKAYDKKAKELFGEFARTNF